MSQEKFIDIRQLIKSKSPKLERFLPGFIIRYLKRILHQDEVNDFIERNGHLKNEAFCNVIVDEFRLNIQVSGLEHLPTSGGAILAMNHPLGGMDAMALLTAIQSQRTDVKFIVNDLLLNLKPLQEIFVGVNKHGSNKRNLNRQMEELFASNQLVGVFPAGLVSRKKQGIIKDLEWRKTFVKYAKRYDKPIIPIFIDGQLSNFFYRLSNVRSFFGIKLNLEMLYLSDELFKQKGKTINYVIGEPIWMNQMDTTKNEFELAQKIKEKVYSLQTK